MSIEREEINKLETRIAKLVTALEWIATTEALDHEYRTVASNALFHDRVVPTREPAPVEWEL